VPPEGDIPEQRALGRKVSDEFTVPLCRGHHRETHRSGDEAAWWKNAGIDRAITARALWLKTHPLPTIRDTGPTIDRLAAMRCRIIMRMWAVLRDPHVTADQGFATPPSAPFRTS
jgi:hypothetical protein